jgi:hypothetical protein
LQELKEKNKNLLENLLGENNAKEKDLEILRKRVMMETNQLNGINGKIILHSQISNEKNQKDVSHYLP